jgi:hypothetical protein
VGQALRLAHPTLPSPSGRRVGVEGARLEGRDDANVGRAYLPDIGPSNTRLRLINRPCRAGMPDLQASLRTFALLPSLPSGGNTCGPRLVTREGQERASFSSGAKRRKKMERGRPARKKDSRSGRDARAPLVACLSLSRLALNLGHESGDAVFALNRRFWSARPHPALRATLLPEGEGLRALLLPGEGLGMRARGSKDATTRM